MKLKCVHVRAGRDVTVDDNLEIKHSTLIEPKGKPPYFSVLLKSKEPTKNESAMGFRVSVGE